MMRYAAIDIETTGLDAARCQILEIGCVVETDWKTPVEELPTFRALVHPGRIEGELPALVMNAGLLKEIVESPSESKVLRVAIGQLSDFLIGLFGKGSITIAGKNFAAFDLRFLRQCDEWCWVHHKHRFIDVGNLWWHPEVDTCLPSLVECRDRAGTPFRSAHSAVEDCRCVVELVREATRRRVEPALRGGAAP
jgi:DNA polymerase III epsilon subunit-like protein